MTRFILLFLFYWSMSVVMWGQTTHNRYKVAITIDDVPSTNPFSGEQSMKFLEILDSLQIPIAIFINERSVARVHQGEALLDDWISRDFVTTGNHTLNHARYSDVGIDSFMVEVKMGERLTRELTATHGKKLTYFRFPYNDLGKDTLQHHSIRGELEKLGYVIAPFTVESSDWMFNAVYVHYQKNGMEEKAATIGHDYVRTTLAYFEHFENIADELYQRPVSHIYLAHDNAINADYLPLLIQELHYRGYGFISISEALKDPIYSQKDLYFQKWGISWLYRWMSRQEERRTYFKKEPSIQHIDSLYQSLNN